MLDERSEHEPEEYDPEAELYDLESDSLTIPQVDVPGVETPDGETTDCETPDGKTSDDVADSADVPAGLARQFWILVLVLDAAVLAVSLGAMLVYFRGDLHLGGTLVIGGLALCAFAYRRYRDAKSIAGGDGAERPSIPGTERTAPVDADTDDT